MGKKLFEVLDLVNSYDYQLFFMTFSCAELRWDELIYITASLQGENLQDEYIQNIVFLYAVNINLNPVLLATYFQY